MKVFILLASLTLVALAVKGDPANPTPQELALAEIYSNFSHGVLEALAKDDESLPQLPEGSPLPAVPPVTITSLVGLTHILAVVHEKLFPVSVPVFEKLLAVTPKNLPESFDLLASTIAKDDDIKYSSLIFTSEKLEKTPALTKLGVEIVSTDLKTPEAVGVINGKLGKLLAPLTDSFIPKGATISPAAIALIADTLHLTEQWPAPLKKIPKVKFNGKEEVEMVELVGKYHVVESDKFVEVFIPFKNGKRSISLSMILDEAAILKGEIAEGKPLDLPSVKIHIPLFSIVLREPQASLASSAKCEFKKESNFLHLLEEFAYVSLDENKFEALSVSAAQINNVEAFKKELAKGNKGKAVVGEVPAGSADKPLPPPPPSAPGAEKLIVFDRPFSWNVLDENLGPLYAGSVESIALLKTKVEAKTDATFVFGSEKSLPFEKCL